MEIAWESELTRFLNELTAVQDETLQLLAKKRELLGQVDKEGLATIAPQEESLVQRLRQCLADRESLLARAGSDGLPTESLRAVAKALPKAKRKPLDEQFNLARARTRLLQHHSLTNWVLVQRTLLHLSQVLEIIATGGRLQPTYGKGAPPAASGSLVDRAI